MLFATLELYRRLNIVLLRYQIKRKKLKNKPKTKQRKQLNFQLFIDCKHIFSVALETSKQQTIGHETVQKSHFETMFPI